MTPSDLDAWADQFAAFHARFAPFFFRKEVRERSARYLQSLLSPVERKNGWQLAEAMGEHDPNSAQRLLYQAVWNEDAVRDELQAFVGEHFGDAQTGIFVVDETGFLKKGTKSVGVQRQYSGTAGKVENCQVGVFLAYASPRGYAFLDRRLYLPQDWAGAATRRAAAGVPETVPFQTKPQLARQMLEHAWAQGVAGQWVTADEVYGSDWGLRQWREDRAQAYVLAVRSTERVWVTRGQGPQEVAVAQVAAAVAPEAWQRLSAGDGAKGPRVYDWAVVPLAVLAAPGWEYELFVRRSLADPTDLAYYLVFAPQDTALAALVRVAGSRWVVEQCFEEAQGEVGLDHYEVRSWRSWHRHLTLALLAHAFLAWVRQGAALAEPPGGKTLPGARPGGADRSRSAAAVSAYAAVAFPFP